MCEPCGRGVARLLPQPRLRKEVDSPASPRLQDAQQRLPRAHVRRVEEAHALVAHDAAQLLARSQALLEATGGKLHLAVGRGGVQRFVDVALALPVAHEYDAIGTVVALRVHDELVHEAQSRVEQVPETARGHAHCETQAAAASSGERPQAQAPRARRLGLEAAASGWEEEDEQEQHPAVGRVVRRPPLRKRGDDAFVNEGGANQRARRSLRVSRDPRCETSRAEARAPARPHTVN